MAEDFNLAEAVMWGSLEAAQRFDGLKNTQELISTVEEMFDGANIRVTSVQGEVDKFKCSVSTNAKTEEEIKDLVSTFERNTNITTKVSKYKYVMLSFYLFIHKYLLSSLKFRPIFFRPTIFLPIRY